jgi:hypothetical protein
MIDEDDMHDDLAEAGCWVRVESDGGNDADE